MTESPLPPNEFAARLVKILLADLSPQRQATIQTLIEEWGTAWGDLIGGVAMESGER